MCLMIYKPKGRTIPKQHIKTGFESNPDGAGFMYLDKKGNVTISKGYFSFPEFYKAFKAREKRFPQSPFVLHMRIGTSGVKDTNNCHPFGLLQGAGFAHNGILGQFSYANSNHSDTWHYANQILKPLGPHFWTDKKVNEMLERDAKTTGSKFCLLTRSGVKIYNEMAGHYSSGIWYSNNTYRSIFSVQTRFRSWLSEIGDTMQDDRDLDYKSDNWIHK
jgi:predicted glutamine amidotransferase